MRHLAVILPLSTIHSNSLDLEDDKSHDNPSHDPRKSSVDSYHHNSSPPSRRQSDIMPPPSNVAKIAHLEKSTPKATSPPANSKIDPQQPSNTELQVPLLYSLNAFAQSITSAANLTMRRDLTKQQSVVQQRERDRQSKYKSVFPTLAEDAESRVEGTEKVFIGIEKQLDLSSHAQSKNAFTLAELLKQANGSDALLSARDQACIKDDIAGIKSDISAAATDNASDRGLIKDDIAAMKADIKTAKNDIIRDRDRFKQDLADSKANLKAAEKKFKDLTREAIKPAELRDRLRDLASKDELRELVAKDELRGLVAKNESSHKHVTETLISTEKTITCLTSANASLTQKVTDVEDVIRKHCENIEGKDQRQYLRFAGLDDSLSNLQMQLSRLGQEHKRENHALKVDLLAQDKVLTELKPYVRPNSTNDGPSLDQIVMRNSEQIQSVQQECEKLSVAMLQAHDLRAASNTQSSPQASKASIDDKTKSQEDVKLVQSDLDALKAEQEHFEKVTRQDLEALKADREKVLLIRTDLDSLVVGQKDKDEGVTQTFEAIEGNMKILFEKVARLQSKIMLVQQSQASQTLPNHPPTPPIASASTSPRESDQQQLQEVKMELHKLMETTSSLKSLEVFVVSQQEKFDGLTTDRLVQSMVHQLQQMYPLHPGNLMAWRDSVHAYLHGDLKVRLANIESNITVLCNKTEEIFQFNAETRKINLATINSMKQDIEGLRDLALYNRPQCPSDYGNRIDELVKAIGDLQTSQTDLVRNLTQLQQRNGIGSTRNTLEELTVTSRSSKSIEPNGANEIPSEKINDSDNSDTPLSQRADRGVHGEREDRGSSGPNLKRKAAESDDDDEDDGEEARPTNLKRVPKRLNVSGKHPFS